MNSKGVEGAEGKGFFHQLVPVTKAKQKLVDNGCGVKEFFLF